MDMTKELPDNSGNKVINGRLHVKNANGNYEPVPISMDEARTMGKASLAKTYVSDTTKVHLQSAADKNIDGGVKVASSLPGIAYGVIDVAAGEKISGVAALAGALPNYVKGKVALAQGNVERIKAGASLAKDTKGMDMAEKRDAVVEFVKTDVDINKAVAQDKYEEITDTLRGVVGTTKDITSKSGATNERRIPDVSNMKSANTPGMEFQ